ncbi:MAG: FHA domain-containing protein [Candidatus Binatus sp.]|uniref:FHA domain-containing protein n=1 Tax=Candidatus Binatus sp. TaxID=2811406 RepID=UPI003C796C83
MPHRSTVEGAPPAESVFQRPAAGYYITNLDAFAGGGVNSPLALLKSDSLNRRELTFKALAGLVGGAIGWLPVELASHNHTLTESPTSAQAWATAISMCLLSGLIGGFIVAAEGQRLDFGRDAQLRFARGFGICAFLAYFGNEWSNDLFSIILDAGGWGVGHQGSVLFLILGRVTSWTVLGAVLGAGVGIATLSPPNILKGGLGGVVGGFLGGFTFDFINLITGGGLAGRLVGLSLIGLAIGLFIGLVQELTKAAWVTVEHGRLRGRQYRIEGARASIGRAEENPVGLFGDPSVQQRHAVIERRGADYVIRNLAVQDGTFVNGKRIESVDLRDGDRIGIGGYEMLFHLRGTSAPARQQSSLTVDTVNPAHVATRLAGANAKLEGPSLIDASGQPYPVRSGTVTRIGRALDNDIVAGHSSVSRHHASIENSDGVFAVKDLNSQNGTFVGNRRVTEPTRVSDGDTVRFGDAQFTFRG